jgi:DNA-binding NarL/FixJ family response regulator
MLNINNECLSKREKQVYSHIIKGESQKDIAKKLYICLRTVKFHCGNIYQKLKVKNKAELIKHLHVQEQVLQVQEKPQYFPPKSLMMDNIPPSSLRSEPRTRPEFR